MSELILNARSSPGAPSTNQVAIYADVDTVPDPPAVLSYVDEQGSVFRIGDRRVKLTADLGATTSTTLANTTGLSFAVKSGVYYRFHFLVVYTTVTITTGLKVGLTTPTFTIYAATVRGVVAAGATSAQWTDALSSSGDSSIQSGVETTVVPYIAEIEGIILPSADGTLQVQHAAEVGAAGNVIVKQGSCGQLWVM
jgi:hypothetical protein